MGLLDKYFGVREGFVKKLYKKSGEKEYEGHIKNGKQVWGMDWILRKWTKTERSQL